MNTRIKTHVKNGDTVQVISGKYKGEIGTIKKVLPKSNKVIIENINLKTKHLRPKQKEESGQIINFEAPIHSSNVMLYSKKHQTRSRYNNTIDANSEKYRKLKKTQEHL